MGWSVQDHYQVSISVTVPLEFEIFITYHVAYSHPSWRIGCIDIVLWLLSHWGFTVTMYRATSVKYFVIPQSCLRTPHRSRHAVMLYIHQGTATLHQVSVNNKPIREMISMRLCTSFRGTGISHADIVLCMFIVHFDNCLPVGKIEQ